MGPRSTITDTATYDITRLHYDTPVRDGMVWGVRPSHVGDAQRLPARVRVPPVADESHREHHETGRDVSLTPDQHVQQGLAPLLFPLDRQLRLNSTAGKQKGVMIKDREIQHSRDETEQLRQASDKGRINEHAHLSLES